MSRGFGIIPCCRHRTPAIKKEAAFVKFRHGEFADTSQPNPKKATSLIPQKLLSVCPLAVAALLILARSVCESLALPAPTVDQILAATKVSRSTAYAMVAVIARLLPTLTPERGRPPKVPPPPESKSTTLTRGVLAYVMRHPGCVQKSEVRQHYSDGFRRCVLDLRAEHAALDVEAFAAASLVPLGTLKDWLRESPPPPVAEAEPAAPVRPDAEGPQMQTVLDAWARWQGSFLAFCDHVRNELRVPFGREMIARILEVHGRRKRAPRDGRRPDEIALRGAFRTYFPGAQWVGDGMQLPVTIDGRRFTFNVELDVDAHTAAFTGASVRNEEDAAAVIEAFDDGVASTGNPPLALLLDNRPSNHTPEVDQALGDTIRIRATPARPQNKGHVEGAFGLFSQQLPALALDTRGGAQAVAAALARLVVQIWGRTTNHRPRADRGGRSRVELYSDSPTDEQIDQARRQLRQTAERQELARRTLLARRRPEVIALLDEHFARLGLLDPERHVRIAIAGYPMYAVVDGIAIFDGKCLAKTLPDGADARYLLGIVRNVAAQAEGEHIAIRLFQLRLEARDQMLAALVAKRIVVCADTNAVVVADCVDRALATQSPLERTFWIGALADVLRTRDLAQRQPLFLAAARRIEATFAIGPRERHIAVRQLADRLIPLA